MTSRLDELKTELGKHFGKFTRWRVLCQEQNATTEEDKIRLAELALAAYSTGTVAEWNSYHLRLQGVKPMNIDEFLTKNADDQS